MITTVLVTLSLLSLALAMFATYRVVRAAKNSRFIPARVRSIALEKVPSVSVCIPARNEDQALGRCLDAVIASDYPKLEIIVLDDDSVDNTSALARSYAHTGVRFIKGKDLPEGWIGRNYAYDNLREQASGRYIFFMSVDTHIGPESISQLVAYMMHKRVEMASVLPARLDGLRPGVLFAPLRYLQELVFSSKRSPATISSGWIVNRELLENYFEGFDRFKDDILVERRIAEEFAQHDAYGFLINADQCDISFEKHWSSQIETSVRVYALTAASSVVRFTGSLLLALLASFPTLCILSACFMGFGPAFWVSLTTELAYMAMYVFYTSLVWSHGAWLAWLFWPFVILQETVLLVVAAAKRKRGTITWKGRPIFGRQAA
ncbi:MAG: glycosyltransferase [Candidatus Nomurabacteria bacterium]|jgi:glycosyltransferase involved in cell wall biosynthesis|nr:glycosyltransferase [Candidatus Nomurabacteria bacterium]